MDFAFARTAMKMPSNHITYSQPVFTRLWRTIKPGKKVVWPVFATVSWGEAVKIRFRRERIRMITWVMKRYSLPLNLRHSIAGMMQRIIL